MLLLLKNSAYLWRFCPPSPPSSHPPSLQLQFSRGRILTPDDPPRPPPLLTGKPTESNQQRHIKQTATKPSGFQNKNSTRLFFFCFFFNKALDKVFNSSSVSFESKKTETVSMPELMSRTTLNYYSPEQHFSCQKGHVMCPTDNWPMTAQHNKSCPVIGPNYFGLCV